MRRKQLKKRQPKKLPKKLNNNLLVCSKCLRMWIFLKDMFSYPFCADKEHNQF